MVRLHSKKRRIKKKGETKIKKKRKTGEKSKKGGKKDWAISKH